MRSPLAALVASYVGFAPRILAYDPSARIPSVHRYATAAEQTIEETEREILEVKKVLEGAQAKLSSLETILEQAQSRKALAFEEIDLDRKRRIENTDEAEEKKDTSDRAVKRSKAAS